MTNLQLTLFLSPTNWQKMPACIDYKIFPFKHGVQGAQTRGALLHRFHFPMVSARVLTAVHIVSKGQYVSQGEESNNGQQGVPYAEGQVVA